MKINDIMCEAKFSRPITAYHGTPTKNLKSIISQGLTPKTGGFGAHIKGSLNNRDMSAVGGVYFSTSAQYAGFAAKMQDSSPTYGMVEVSVQTRSAYVDEDDVANNVKRLLTPSSMNIERDVVKSYLMYSYDKQFKEKVNNSLVKLYPPLSYQNENFFDMFVKSHYARMLSHVNLSTQTTTIQHVADVTGEDVDVLSADLEMMALDADTNEKIYKQALDRLTRALKSNVHNFKTRYGALGDSFRIADNIQFSGNNKITGVFEIDDSNKTIIIHYGTVGEIMNSQYYQSFQVIKK